MYMYDHQTNEHKLEHDSIEEVSIMIWFMWTFGKLL